MQCYDPRCYALPTLVIKTRRPVRRWTPCLYDILLQPSAQPPGSALSLETQTPNTAQKSSPDLRPLSRPRPCPYPRTSTSPSKHKVKRIAQASSASRTPLPPRVAHSICHSKFPVRACQLSPASLTPKEKPKTTTPSARMQEG